MRLCSWMLLVSGTFVGAEDAVDFNRDVRPILSDNCFACHGFDESSREAGLRLDVREGATADLGGYAAIAPGESGVSELISRAIETDPDMRMPPQNSHKQPLNSQQIETLRRWIDEGAVWGKHWAFEPPVQAAIPTGGLNPIDYFVRENFKQLSRSGIVPAGVQLVVAPPAAPHTLARRLSFDLTGLPPTADHVSLLGSDPSAADWNQYIEQLLQSPHYGERMAMWWLDGARYADTDGFQQDATRENWPWRDWVIDAFNENMPFDEFTIQQFAGDLLPDATDESRLATCFHRNHMHNGEGGRDPEESRVDYVLDRTNTVGTLWLGLTLGCTQCHDHKFDPISQRDYYSMTAYFDSIDEDGQAGNKAKPFLDYQSDRAHAAVEEAEQLVKQTSHAVAASAAAAEDKFQQELSDLINRVSDGFVSWHHVEPAALSSVEGTSLAVESQQIIRSGSHPRAQDDFHITVGKIKIDRVTGLRLEVFADDAHTGMKYSHADSGEFVLTNVKLQVRSERTTEVVDVPLVGAVASVNGVGEDSKYGDVAGTLDDDPRTGWTTRSQEIQPVQTAVFELVEPVILEDDQRLDIVLMQRSLAPNELIGRFRVSLTDQRGSAVRSLEIMPLQRLADAITERAVATEQPFRTQDIDAGLIDTLRKDWLEDYPPHQILIKRDDLARSQLKHAKAATGKLRVTVLKQRETPRTTHLLLRGVWDAHGEQVMPAILPAVLPRPADQVRSRLELAEWIVDRKNPLTARVIVNQIWQQLFGFGLVRTPADFGVQGELPTHPQLLDFLAVEFMESGWDVKQLIRRIVRSETYRQDSGVNDALQQADPDNRWLARGTRFRLPSWMIRDSLLRTSGLMNDSVGGPPVFPYQPPGVWEDQFMGRFSYQPSVGPAQYRRSVYAFWRRTSAPTFLFDNAMRRTCEVNTGRTNTPLHALTLMNDLTSLEAARAISDTAFHIQPVEARLADLMNRILCRPPSDREANVLHRYYDEAFEYYAGHREQAVVVTTVGQQLAPDPDKVAELAATMLVASMIYNFDESMTHE